MIWAAQLSIEVPRTGTTCLVLLAWTCALFQSAGPTTALLPHFQDQCLWLCQQWKDYQVHLPDGRSSLLLSCQTSRGTRFHDGSADASNLYISIRLTKKSFSDDIFVSTIIYKWALSTTMAMTTSHFVETHFGCRV